MRQFFVQDLRRKAASWARSPFSLNRGLVTLVLACTLPLAVYSVVILQQYTTARHTGARAHLVSVSQALALAVEHDINEARHATENLAISPSLHSGPGGIERFQARSVQLVKSFGDKSWLLLVRPDRSVARAAGQHVADAMETLKPLFDEVDRRRGTVVSGYLEAPGSHSRFIAIVVPVWSVDGRRIEQYIVHGLDLSKCGEILAEVALPSGWASTIVDGTGRILGRTVDPQHAIGQRTPPEFRAMLAAKREGVFESTTYDGRLNVIGAFTPMPSIGWHALVFVERDRFFTPMHHALWSTVGGGLIAVMAGLGMALWLSRRVSEPLNDLVRAARTIGNGVPFTMHHALRLHETREIAEVLQASSERIEIASAERERVLGELRALTATLEQRVADRTLELEAARYAAEDANQAKSDFLARISHEIRTPLTGTLATIDLLLTGDLTESQRDRLLVLRRTNMSLKHLLSDILDFAKIEANRLEIESIPYSPKAVLGDAVKLVEGVATDKSLVISASADELPARVVGDPHRLRQVLTNLLTNAVTHTREGTIHVAARPLNGGQTLEFIVTDTGVGLAESVKKQLFEPFPQGTAASARRHGGVGLGLAICKQLVTAMNGTIMADSAPGQGTQFTFTISVLPLGAARLNVGANSLYVDVAGLGGRILVAEDNPTNRPLIVEMLARMGHLVDSVENGAEALEAVRHNHYDVVVMDIQMPRMSGIEAAKEIRALEDEEKAHVHIIALTADSGVLARRNGPSLFDEYEPKPIDWLQLGQKIQRGISRQLSHEGIDMPAERTPQLEIWRDLPLLDVTVLERLKDKLGADRLAKLIATLPTNVTGQLQQTTQAFERCDMAVAEAGAHSVHSTAAFIGMTQLAAVAQQMQQVPSQPALLALQDSLTQSLKEIRGWSARHLSGVQGAGLRLAVKPADNG